MVKRLDLPDAELYYRNKVAKTDSQEELAGEYGCGDSTIGRHIKEFEELVNADDPKAVTELNILKKENEFADAKTYSEELEARTDARPEEYQGIEVDGEESEEYLAVDMRPDEPWYKRLWNWFRGLFT